MLKRIIAVGLMLCLALFGAVFVPQASALTGRGKTRLPESTPAPEDREQVNALFAAAKAGELTELEGEPYLGGTLLIAVYDDPESAQPVTLPVPEFRNNATWAVIKAVHGEESFGLFLRDRYGKGVMYTLAVPDARPDMYNLPSGVLSRMRQALAVNGIWMEGPSRISLFVYDNDTFIVYPYVMDGVQRTCIRLHVSGAKALEIPVGNRTLEPLYTQHGEAIFEVPAMPGDYMLYRIIR